MKKRYTPFIILSLIPTLMFSQTNTFPDSGNVGIGTLTPTEKLEVIGNIKASGNIISGSINAGAVQADTVRTTQLRADSSVRIANSIIIDGVNDKITATSGNILFENTNIISNGNITSNSLTTNNIVTGQLVIDSLHALEKIAVNHSLFFTKETANNFAEVSTTGSNVSLILQKDSASRVGIGTAPNANEKLTVNGNVGITNGNLRVTNLAGAGDRQMVVDANGNLKSGNPLPNNPCPGLDPQWNTYGNDIPVGPLCNPYLGTNSATDLVFKTNADNDPNGGERMRITATGKVGIGTTNPQCQLDVAAAPGQNGMCVSTTSGAIGFLSKIDNNSSKAILVTNTTTGNSNFVVLGDGTTGIGTTTPYKKLTVNGDVSLANYCVSPCPGNQGDGFSGLEILGNNQVPTRRGISIDPDPNGSVNFFINVNQNPSAFNFKDGNANKTLMKIDGLTGNVGIGTITPSQKLDVQGTIFATGLSTNTWTNSHWNVPFVVPNGSAIRTNNTGVFLNKYLGFGMTDNGGVGGWYWIASCVTDDSQPPSYPMSLTLHPTTGAPTLTLLQNNWCDFVFDENYKRDSFEEQEKYLIENKHLKNIHSQSQVEKDGLNIGQTLYGITLNVEEAKLDMIDLYKMIKKQGEKIEQLEKENIELKKIINK